MSEPLTAKQRLEKINEALDNYEKSKGLLVQPNNDGIRYLNMPQKEMHSLTADECGEAATLLSQYSFSIQRELNRERAIVNWCEAELRRHIFTESGNYSGTGEERKAKAIAGNEYTRNLDKLRAQAQGRVDQLEYQPNRIDAIRMSFIELQQTRRKGGGSTQ